MAGPEAWGVSPGHAAELPRLRRAQYVGHGRAGGVARGALEGRGGCNRLSSTGIHALALAAAVAVRLLIRLRSRFRRFWEQERAGRGGAWRGRRGWLHSGLLWGLRGERDLSPSPLTVRFVCHFVIVVAAVLRDAGTGPGSCSGEGIAMRPAPPFARGRATPASRARVDPTHLWTSRTCRSGRRRTRCGTCTRGTATPRSAPPRPRARPPCSDASPSPAFEFAACR